MEPNGPNRFEQAKLLSDRKKIEKEVTTTLMNSVYSVLQKDYNFKEDEITKFTRLLKYDIERG